MRKMSTAIKKFLGKLLDPPPFKVLFIYCVIMGSLVIGHVIVKVKNHFWPRTHTITINIGDDGEIDNVEGATLHKMSDEYFANLTNTNKEVREMWERMKKKAEEMSD